SPRDVNLRKRAEHGYEREVGESLRWDLRNELERFLPGACEGERIRGLGEQDELPLAVSDSARECNAGHVGVLRFVVTVAPRQVLAEVGVGAEGRSREVVLEGDRQRVLE